ncbi:hypothetical protein A2U01_0016242 [Trifolium medium]|uniref:Uncharacterized protein n=1 Tax=Trifolium medium TaxID=97028 RepID=A0A392N631_9FABA|nr:hypothetical protein [Trifolium medium]
MLKQMEFLRWYPNRATPKEEQLKAIKGRGPPNAISGLSD